MARRELSRRMIEAAFFRAVDALAWATARASDALALVKAARHPVRSPRTAVEAARPAPPVAKVAPATPAAPAVPAEPELLPEPWDPEFRLDTGTARVTTTSRGRKTVPIAVASARRARAKIEPKPGIRPKHGQKKRH